MLVSRLLGPLLSLVACAPEDDTRTLRARPGPPAEDTAEHDVRDTDPGDTDSTAVPDDTAPEETAADTAPDPDTSTTAQIACYLGPDRAYSVCLPTVVADGGDDYAYADPYEGSPQYAAPTRYLDLDAEDPAEELAPNFVLEELAEAWKGRWGVVQPHLLDRLQELRDAIDGPLTVTSGYRSPAYNAGVGGVTYSRHQYGDAVDLDADGWSVEALGEECEDVGADYVGLYEDGHTHCDWRDEPLDPAFYGGSRAAPPAARPAPTARLLRGAVAWSAPAEGFDEGEPFRRWTAWDADGKQIATGTGRSWTPPGEAVTVRVVVGGNVTIEASAR